MPRINTPDSLGNTIALLTARINRLENAQRSAVAVTAADPPNLMDGDHWVRTSDSTFHVRIGGVTKTVTVT